MMDTLHSFVPNAPDAAGVISWAHLGDLHMTLAGEQNHLDLRAMVDELNAAFAGSLAFVFLPGDVADHGSAAEYAVVREELDRLKAPWCAIVGDHDVHEKSFANFTHFMSPETQYSFVIGDIQFIALNAFGVPDPGSFILLSDQLEWLEKELEQVATGKFAVLLLHCYPSDLKQGGGRLRELATSGSVRLIDMGHTHYNEVANDGKIIYTATRSTGQIEEGEAGFSVTNLDGGVVSWRFFPLGGLPAVMITSPVDERFIAEGTVGESVVGGRLRVRAKTWGQAPFAEVVASFGEKEFSLSRIGASQVWEGELAHSLQDGVVTLSVTARDEAEGRAVDTIRVVVGRDAYKVPHRAERDQDNALEAWPERGLLGNAADRTSMGGSGDPGVDRSYSASGHRGDQYSFDAGEAAWYP